VVKATVCNTVISAVQIRLPSQESRIMKTNLKVWMAHLWGHLMVFVAPTHQDVVKHIMKMGYVQGIGPMDLGDRIWELPAGGYPEGKVTLVCAGDREIERAALARIEEAERNKGAGI
jgi:hypothetical protein